MTQSLMTAMCGTSAILILSGCSIAMALHGHPEPNFEAFEVGSTRKQAELQLGIPTSTKALEAGKKEDTYKYEMGNSPNGARATLYFYYDLATLGFAEPIFSIIEVFQGHDEETRIVYSIDDHILEIKGFRPPPSSLELKAAQVAQQQHVKPPKIEGSSDAVGVGNPSP